MSECSGHICLPHLEQNRSTFLVLLFVTQSTSGSFIQWSTISSKSCIPISVCRNWCRRMCFLCNFTQFFSKTDQKVCFCPLQMLPFSLSIPCQMINTLIALKLILLYNKINGYLRVIRLVEYDLTIPYQMSITPFVSLKNRVMLAFWSEVLSIFGWLCIIESILTARIFLRHCDTIFVSYWKPKTVLFTFCHLITVNFVEGSGLFFLIGSTSASFFWRSFGASNRSMKKLSQVIFWPEFSIISTKSKTTLVPWLVFGSIHHL